jgi:cytoskeletal protein RodZ
METLGQFLKAARIQSNKSLEEIAESTKIRKGLLEAIEEERNELLPPRIYLRGMIKLFAREVGVDPNLALERFESADIESPENEKTREIKRPLQATSKKSYIPLVLIVAVAFLVYLFLTNKNLVQDESSLVTAPPQKAVIAASTTTSAVVTTTLNPSQTTDVKTASPPAAVSTPAVTPAPAATQPASPFTIRFEAQALTWMRIQVDQEKHFDILLRPGESYKHTASRAMSVRLGNAGGVTIYSNDTLLGTAGKPGEVMNLQFPDAMKQLQQPR